MDLYHGSNEMIGEIKAGGVFGGLFASTSERAASSHGEILHRIESPRHLTDYALNYEIENGYEIALELAGGNEAIADAIMSAGCESLPDCDPDDSADQGWEFQRLRGRLAARLGYTSVEMRDEHGTTCLCLPGCTLEIV